MLYAVLERLENSRPSKMGMGRCYSPGYTVVHLKEASMKKMWLAVSAMTLMMSGIVFAQAETPVIDQRQANQDQRIDQGIANGQLNKREANRLNRQQEHVNKMEDRAMSDGAMTKGNEPGSVRHRIVPRTILLARNTTARGSGIGNSKLCGLDGALRIVS